MDIIYKTIDIKLIQEYFRVAKSTAYYWLKNAVLDTLGDGRCIAIINNKFHMLANKKNLPAFNKWRTKVHEKIVVASYHYTTTNQKESVLQKKKQAIIDYLTCHNNWLKEKIPFAIIYMNCEGKKYVRNLNWIQLEKLSKTHKIATRKGKTVNFRQYLHQLAYYDNPRDYYLRYKALAALNIFR